MGFFFLYRPCFVFWIDWTFNFYFISFQHLHVHLLPRKPGDFEENDDIYEKVIMLLTYIKDLDF